MEDILKNYRLFLNSLGPTTRFIAKVSLITVCWAFILAIVTYTLGSFRLFILSDDFLYVARSTATTGFIGSIIMHLCEQNRKNGTG